MVLGMSTRKGTAVFLDDVIREATSVMKEKMMSNEEKYNAIEDPETVAQEIGLSSIKIQDMAAKRYAHCTYLPRRCIWPILNCLFDKNQQLQLQLEPHDLI